MLIRLVFEQSRVYYHPWCHYPHQNHGDLVDGNVGKPGTKVFIGSSAADVQQLLPGDHSFQLLNAHHHHDDDDDFDEGHGDSGIWAHSDRCR